METQTLTGKDWYENEAYPWQRRVWDSVEAAIKGEGKDDGKKVTKIAVRAKGGEGKTLLMMKLMQLWEERGKKSDVIVITPYENIGFYFEAFPPKFPFFIFDECRDVPNKIWKKT